MNSTYVKLVIVGDTGVGKTCLLITYTENKFPEDYIPTVMGSWSSNVTVDNKEYTLALWDTVGDDESTQIRVNSKTSFENVKLKYWGEIQNNNPKTPVILVGTKIDLRNEKGEFVTKKEGLRLAKELGARKYHECSALSKKGLKELLDLALKVSQEKQPEKKTLCKIL